MVVRELITKLGFQSDTSGINQADNSMSSFFKNISAGKLLAVGALAVVAKQVLDIGKAALFAAADMEMLTTQFEVMLGDAGAAEGMMDKLNQFAASTPFALDTLAKGSQQLLSFGVSADDVVDTMRMLGDTAGGNAEKLNGLILAYGKVQVKGKASMEEINMIAERGLPIYDVLAKQLNTTKEGLFGMISAGQVSAEAMKQAFKTLTSEGGMFFKGMEKQSTTFHGLMSTMYDNFKLTMASAGKILLPLAKEVVLFITDIARQLEPILSAIFEVVIAVLKPLFDVLKPILTILLTVISVIIQVAAFFLKVLIWPIAFAFKMLATALNFFLLPFKLLGDLFTLVSEKISAFFAPLNQIKNIFAELFTPLDALNMIFSLFIEKMKPVVDLFNGLVQMLQDKLAPIIGYIQEIFLILSEVLKALLAPVLEYLGGIFSWLAETLGKYLIPVFKFLGDIFDWVGQKINQFVDWLISIVNKLPGVNISRDEIKKKVSVKMPSASQQMMKGSGGKTTNVSMKNNITMKGTGNTKEDVTRIAESIFTIQLKQVLTDAGI